MDEIKLIWHFMRNWAMQFPDREALVFRDRRVTYKEFYEKTCRVAKLLLELNVKKGDRVFTLSAARDEYMYIYMASSMIGAIWYGLNPKYTRDELLYQVGDAGPKVGFLVRNYDVTMRDYKDDMMAVKEANPTLEHLVVFDNPWEGTINWDEAVAKERKHLDAELENRIKQVHGDDPALIIYTSGTTGQPKGSLLTHRNIIASATVQNRHFASAVQKGEPVKLLIHFPINHVACAVELAMGGLEMGGTIIMMDRFEGAATLKAIQEEKVNFLGQVPAMFMLEFMLPDYDKYDLSSLKVIVWSGAAAQEGMINRLRKTGALLMTGYGQTENAGFITFTDPGDKLDDLMHTAGKCDPSFGLKIMGANGKEMPRGEVGEIWMRGDIIMKGYWNRKEATAETITPDGWLKSGDLATMDSRGYITIVGRTKEMFKSGGENIYPREIEAVIEQHPDVAFASVIAIPDDTWQEVGKAFVMPVPGKNVNPDDLRELCKKHLSNYKVPKQFEIRPLLPLLPSGKVDKLALVAEEKNARKAKG
jgi:acyl-CoA synthetase (AMP-forming)/AMP-acid ligase II